MLSYFYGIFRLDDESLVIIGSFLVLIFLYRFLNISILEYFFYIKNEIEIHLYAYYKSLLLLQKDLKELTKAFIQVFFIQVDFLNLLEVRFRYLVYNKFEKLKLISKIFLIKILFFNFKKLQNFLKLIGFYALCISPVFKINIGLSSNLDLLEEIIEKE